MLEPVTGTTSWGNDLAEAKAVIAEPLALYAEEAAHVPPSAYVAGPILAGGAAGTIWG